MAATATCTTPPTKNYQLQYTFILIPTPERKDGIKAVLRTEETFYSKPTEVGNQFYRSLAKARKDFKHFCKTICKTSRVSWGAKYTRGLR